MRLGKGLVAVGMVVGANLALVAPAHAACVGTQNVAGVCVENQVIYSDCIYVASDTCQPVRLSGPRVTDCWLLNPSIIACI